MSAAASQMYCTAANGGIGSSWVLRGQVEHVRSAASFTSVVSAAVTAGTISHRLLLRSPASGRRRFDATAELDRVRWISKLASAKTTSEDEHEEDGEKVEGGRAKGR